MLHSLPALLDDLERRLIAGEDPLPLLGMVRWPDVIDWPKDPQQAMALRRKVSCLHTLIQGLQAPIQATLMAVQEQSAYQAKGGFPVPSVVSLRFGESV